MGILDTPALTRAQLDARGNALTIGEETLLRDIAFSSAVVTSSGALRLAYFTARKSETTTQVRVGTGGAAAAATPTLIRVGLYTIDGTGAGALVAATASDTAMFAAVNTTYTRAWAASYAKVAGQRYALGVLVVTPAATPTFVGQAVSADSATDPRLTGQVAAQTDLPSSFTAGQVTASGSRIYGVVLP